MILTLDLRQTYLNHKDVIIFFKIYIFLFQEWYITKNNDTVYGMKLPTGFQLIGQVVRP